MILQFVDSTMPWFKINGQTNSFQSLDFYTERRAKFCRMTVSSMKLCFFFRIEMTVQHTKLYIALPIYEKTFLLPGTYNCFEKFKNIFKLRLRFI